MPNKIWYPVKETKLPLHAEFTCINGHKSVGLANKWRKHRCPHCPKEARSFGPEIIGILDVEKPLICKVLEGEF